VGNQVHEIRRAVEPSKRGHACMSQHLQGGTTMHVSKD
jgi:hypothetical protein